VLERTVAPVGAVPVPHSPVRDGRPIAIAIALANGHRLFPEARLAWIEMPAQGSGVIKLRVQLPGDPSQRFPHSYIYIDAYSGAVLGILDARRGSASTTINNWLHPLHDASVAGANVAPIRRRPSKSTNFREYVHNAHFHSRARRQPDRNARFCGGGRSRRRDHRHRTA
jgi:hypothetical protein